jgi:hypothetical protein
MGKIWDMVHRNTRAPLRYTQVDRCSQEGRASLARALRAIVCYFLDAPRKMTCQVSDLGDDNSSGEGDGRLKFR